MSTLMLSVLHLLTTHLVSASDIAVIVAAILSGGLITSLVGFLRLRKTGSAERDSIIADAAERAVNTMNSSLARMDTELNTAIKERNSLLARLNVVERRMELYQRVLHTPDGIVLVSPTGIIEYANDAAHLMLGYSEQELVDSPLDVLIPADLRATHKAHRRAYLKDPKARPMGSGRLLKAIGKDGSEIPVEISLAPVDAGRVVAIMRATNNRS